VEPVPVIMPSADGSSPLLRADTISVSDGAELIVFFENLPTGLQMRDARTELPLMAVLRDKIRDNDPGAARLRQVWVFTYSAPSIPQRIAAGVPFFYHRSGLDSGSAARAPRPLLDMGRPTRGIWSGLAFSAAQAEVFDPIGAMARLTTRSYGTNLGEYRRMHVAEALEVIGSHPDDLAAALDPDEVEAVDGRLELSSKLFGGFVSEEALPVVYKRALEMRSENRGHNWDLLRQAAEENGLYFEPLRLDAAPNSFGVVWIAQRDANSGDEHRFDDRFLRIANPFEDERVRCWNGYSQIWTVDRFGVRMPDGAEGGNQIRMIPLGVYSLDYPGVPLLLVDFRDPSRPQRSEMSLRLMNDVTTGVLGLTTFGNLSYTAAKTGFLFIHKRHGGATNRLSRESAFAQLRHALGTDASLDPGLRRELMSQVEKLALDPVEKSWSQEVGAAWRQYDALMKFASDPRGLAKMVDADRLQEYRAAKEGPVKRMLAGVFHRHSAMTAEQIAELTNRRRVAWSKRQPEGLPDETAPVLARKPAHAPAASQPADGGQ
jgi:hypothetical protein